MGASTGFAGVEPDEVTYRVERDPHRLHVRLRGPALDRRIQQALAVRVLDAVRAGDGTYGQVDVSYEGGQ